MLDRFQFSGSVQCFIVTKKIPKHLIDHCLKAAALGSKGHNTKIIREKYKEKKGIQYASCILFRKEKLPPFLMNGPELDIKHGYALILEADNFLIISKSGAIDFLSFLDDYVRKIDVQILHGAFLDSNSDIEKATAQAIDAKKVSVRTVSYEGTKLQETMPTMGASSKLLKNLKQKNNGQKVSTVGNASRINFAGLKSSIKCFIDQTMETIHRFNKPGHNSFLDNFAIPLKFSDYKDKIKPKEILISTNELVDYISEQDNPNPRLFYTRRNGKRYLHSSLQEYLEKFDTLMEIKETVVNGITQQVIINKLDSSFRIEHAISRYKLKADKLKNIHIEYDDNNSESLLSLINKEEWFNITFDKPEIYYATGTLCQDNRLLGNIDGFLQMFIPDKALENVNSEKGIVTKSTKKFQQKTLFNFVEQTFKPNLDHLILDDLGYETADYIGIKKMLKALLLHCKWDDKILSASAFQIIVGQALKNLNFFAQIDAVDAKTVLWRQHYSVTTMPRIRLGGKVGLANEIKKTLAATNVDREVILVVNFLSYKLLKEQLMYLKAGKPALRSTTPLLWLLNSLRNACTERGVKIYIYCKP